MKASIEVCATKFRAMLEMIYTFGKMEGVASQKAGIVNSENLNEAVDATKKIIALTAKHYEVLLSHTKNIANSAVSKGSVYYVDKMYDSLPCLSLQ